ncbi:hypothetical protein BOTBODRAFT_156022 [Botryobasidium botryosum FD-172 SS1]|uniref:Nucleoside transporter n=1 Tax=Botryobasidium botryosum (strain FD-172 SS1) TaxID=930990 RepID=A0A067N0E2_BOTB1|nr:hypothetical protein BOTBODRAFT_156022 [Botryobasidium botryosum FD-172 SS1]
MKAMYFLLGVSVWLPWFALFTASPYLLTRLEGWRLQPAFVSYLMLASCVSEVMVLAVASWTTTKLNASHRIRTSILVFTITLPILAISPTFTFPPPLFAFLVVVIAVAQSAARAYLEVAVVVHASVYGPFAIQACMAGQSTSGLLINTVQYIIALAAALGQGRRHPVPQPGGPIGKRASEAGTTSAILFFSVTTIFMAAVFLMFHASAMSKLGVVREHPRLASETEALIPLNNTVHEAQAMKLTTADKLEVVKANMAYNVAVAYGYVISMALWPAVTMSIQSVNWAPSNSIFFSPALFTPLHFFVISLATWTGTNLCSYPQLTTWSSRKILSISLARTAFIPLLLLCNIQRPGQESSSPPFINSDIVYFLILVGFGISEGYTITLGLMAAPSIEHNPKLRENQVDVAATVAEFSMISGMAIGSFLSFAVRAAICGCNPFIE